MKEIYYNSSKQLYNIFLFCPVKSTDSSACLSFCNYNINDYIYARKQKISTSLSLHIWRNQLAATLYNNAAVYV